MTATETTETTESATDQILQTDGLTKRFGGLVAVNNIDLSVERGEVRCIIGPNGAGKSTLLKLLVGQLTASSGRILYNGNDITETSQHDRARKGLSMKFQVPAVYNDLTVQQNVRIPLQRRIDGNEINQAIQETLSEFGLSDIARKRAGDLSHGRQQWLEIAMATALDPEMLLLDEPAAGMSVQESEQTAEYIKQLNQEGITLIVIEHDIDFVRSIAQSITVLHQGEVLTQGSIDEVEQNPDVRRIYLGETEE